MPRSKKKVAVDFDDEDSVLAEMGRALDIDPDELTITDRSDFGVSNYEINIRGGRTGKEWHVVADEDAERELAITSKRSQGTSSRTSSSRTSTWIGCARNSRAMSRVATRSGYATRVPKTSGRKPRATGWTRSGSSSGTARTVAGRFLERLRRNLKPSTRARTGSMTRSRRTRTRSPTYWRTN